MYVKELKDTEQYEAPNHQKCHSVRLAGFEEYGPKNFWVGHSQFLPGGGAGRNVVCTILTMLDMKSLSSLIYSSFIQLFCKSQNDFTLYQLCTNIQYPYKIQFMDNLKQKYKKEFPKGTPIVVMCEKGRLEDLKLFVACHDVDGTGVSLKKLLEVHQ